MLTRRAWWFLVSVALVLAFGILGEVLVGMIFPVWAEFPVLALVGLALLGWFGWEWLTFVVRMHSVIPQLRVQREVWDERGPVTSLWAGRSFTVLVRLWVDGPTGLPYVLVRDPVPFGVERIEGESVLDGGVTPYQPVDLTYRIHCPAAGTARFEGLRVEIADLQGFFYHVVFVHAPIVLRVLPALVDSEGQRSSVKRYNLLPPPGIHRLRRPGSGSELLDLRDYLPGDPPKTIAWKVSARRDRLITKEFESEVPVRCTLFVDTSNSVRVVSAGGKALDRLVAIAAGVLQASAAIRDLSGLCLFDEQGTIVVRPDRTGSHLTRMLHLLAEAAERAPAAARVDPEALVPLAYSFAEEVYPELLRPAVNAVPFWLPWFAAFPRHIRRRRSVREWLYRHKRLAFFLISPLVPLLYAIVPLNVLLLIFLLRVLHTPALLALTIVLLSPLLSATVAYLLILLVNRRAQRMLRWRKQLAAMLSVRHGLAPGGLEAMLEDDDVFSLHLQRFLAEHRVPYTLPLYDARGRYQFAAPEKVSVLAGALLQAVGKGHDNELFVLLADLLELDGGLDPLLRAVGVALARHHQVVVVCPWPPGLALPGDHPTAPPPSPSTSLRRLLSYALQQRFEDAYRRLKHAFARRGVPVVCAASDEPVPLILDRIERLRTLRRRR